MTAEVLEANTAKYDDPSAGSNKNGHQLDANELVIDDVD